MTTDSLILIADDDRDQRAGLIELVSGLGAEVLEAETGTEALDILRRWRLRLALLDFHMPGCTGLEILITVREEMLGVPCILLSGEASDILLDSARLEGAHLVLRKPFEPALLRDEVRRVLGHAA